MELHLVVGTVALIAIALLTLGPTVVAPLAGVVLLMSAIAAAALSPNGARRDSGVGDQPDPLRP